MTKLFMNKYVDIILGTLPLILVAMVMFALAIALIYQGRRAKISPDKSPY